MKLAKTPLAIALVSSAVSCVGSVSVGPEGSDGVIAAGPGIGGADPAHGAVGSDGAALDCAHPSLGATPLQRLSRVRYGNSVRALLGLASADIAELAADEKVGPFDGNVISSVSELQLEQYAAAAEAIARAGMSSLPALVPCDRAKLDDAGCARTFIERFGRRTFRRPLSQDEADEYTALFGEFAAGNYANGLRVVVQTMLQSPDFLYHVEATPVAAGDEVIAELDPFELASRLSFFLTDSTPDDALLDAAESGDLRADDKLLAHAERLLSSPTTAFGSFHRQWLAIDDMSTVSKDASAFPSFDAELRAAMSTEVEHFVDYVMQRDDGRLATLFTASYSFPTGSLLDVYGVDANTPGDASSPVALDPTRRAGLLTQPAFLATHSHANQTSPPRIGRVITRNLLCVNLPDPPPDLNVRPPDPAPDLTTRERFEQHIADPSCAGCHETLDGIGFGFEEFDPIGALRLEENGRPVDASGELAGFGAIDGDFSGAVDFAHKLVESQAFHDCAATQWFRFALARMETAADGCALEDLKREFRAGEQNVRDLLLAIVKSPAFGSKRLPGVKP